MSIRLQIATVAALLATISTASAQLKATYTTGTPTGNAPLPTITDNLASPFTETLSVGQSTAEISPFITVAPNTYSNYKTPVTVSGSVAVSFSFTEPTGTVTGVTSTGNIATFSGGVVTVTANYEMFYTGSNSGTDCLTWSGTTCTVTGNQTTIGDTIAITFSDNAVYDVNLYNWSDWNMQPGISFTYVTAPHTTGGQQSAPEPASLALFGTALSGLGLIKRRRSQKKASAI